MNLMNIRSKQSFACKPPTHVQPRLLLLSAAVLASMITLAGCSTPIAAGQGTTSLTAHDLRPVTIESGETAYLSIANAVDQVVLARWQDAGWKLGNTIGLDDAVPTDCALHSRAGADTQVYAACSGPLTVAIPPDGADIVYVTLIIGNDDEVRSANVIAPN